MFKEQMAVYVGCTNNLMRRLHQHRSCSKGTRLYNFINKNNLIDLIKLIPIAEFDHRNEALSFERKLIHRISKMTAYNILNEAYTKGYSFTNTGLTGELCKSSMEWVLINLKTKEIINVISLSNFGRINNLNYKDLNACALGKIHVSQGYKCFKKEKWDSFSEDEKLYYVNSTFLKDIEEYNKKKKIERTSKEYIIITPQQEVLKIKGLDRYAELNGLNKGNLSATSMPKNYGKYCSGYRAFRINDWNNFTQQEIKDILSASKTYRIAGKPKRKDVGNQQPSHLLMEGSTTIENIFDESQIEVSRVGHKRLMSEAVGTRKCDDIV